jgi:hypothetical protein
LVTIYDVLGWQAVQLGTIAMGDLILVLSIFAVGAAFGYFVREWISKKRRQLYIESRRARRSRHGFPLGRH